MASNVVMLIPGQTFVDQKKSGIHNKIMKISSKERDQIAQCEYQQHGVPIDRADSSCTLICDPSNTNGLGPSANC